MKTYSKLKSLYSIKYESVLLAIAVLALIIAVLAPLGAHAATASNIPLCEITRSLKVGSSGEDVRCLQRYLNWSGFTVASTGSGSPGSESAYFGPLTADAVTRWQNANALHVLAPAGIQAGTGYFGPLSFNWYVSVVKTQLGLPA